MKIAVAGMGYVGLSNGVLLAQHNEVWAVDVVAQRVADINARRCPLADKELSEYMTGRRLDRLTCGPRPTRPPRIPGRIGSSFRRRPTMTRTKTISTLPAWRTCLRWLGGMRRRRRS